MKTEILKCNKCDGYTLEKKCIVCGETATTPKPARFSPDDKYGHYRRLAKRERGHL